MKNVILLIICSAIFGYHFSFKGHDVSDAAPESSVVTPVAEQKFRCDGRTHCSQMTSCEEAQFFLDNCPGTAMDGDSDGIPCEKQWCR